MVQGRDPIAESTPAPPIHGLKCSILGVHSVTSSIEKYLAYTANLERDRAMITAL